jgi:hypothetical protein
MKEYSVWLETSLLRKVSLGITLRLLSNSCVERIVIGGGQSIGFQQFNSRVTVVLI